MDELGSTYSKLMIDNLFHVHALTNMYRSSGNEEYLKSANGWMTSLEQLLVDLKRELTKETKETKWITIE